VLDSQVSLSQIEKNLVEAVYDYVMAEAALYRTMGQQYVPDEGSKQ
jgi:outer membrane protein TolC